MAACASMGCVVAAGSAAHANTSVDYAGAGEIGMSLSYTTPPGTVTSPICGATAFAIGGGSEVFVVSASPGLSTGAVGYTGPVDFNGSGTSTCESTVNALQAS